MLSILTFSHDKAYAVDLISLIALPMIIVNKRWYGDFYVYYHFNIKARGSK